MLLLKFKMNLNNLINWENVERKLYWSCVTTILDKCWTDEAWFLFLASPLQSVTLILYHTSKYLNLSNTFSISNLYLTKKHKSVISAFRLLLPQFVFPVFPEKPQGHSTTDVWVEVYCQRPKTLTLFETKIVHFGTLFKTRDLMWWPLFIWYRLFLILTLEGNSCYHKFNLTARRQPFSPI